MTTACKINNLNILRWNGSSLVPKKGSLGAVIDQKAIDIVILPLPPKQIGQYFNTHSNRKRADPFFPNVVSKSQFQKLSNQFL